MNGLKVAAVGKKAYVGQSAIDKFLLKRQWK